MPQSVPCLINEIAEVAPAITLIMQTSLDLGGIPFLGKGTDYLDTLGKVTDLRNQAIALPHSHPL